MKPAEAGSILGEDYMNRIALLTLFATTPTWAAGILIDANVFLTHDTGIGAPVELARQDSTLNPANVSVTSLEFGRQSAQATANATFSHMDVATSAAAQRVTTGITQSSAEASGEMDDTLTFTGEVSRLDIVYTLFGHSIDMGFSLNGAMLPSTGSSGLHLESVTFAPTLTVDIAAKLHETANAFGRGGPAVDGHIGTFDLTSLSIMDGDGLPVSGINYVSASGATYAFNNSTHVQHLPEPSTWLLLGGGLISFVALSKRRLRG